MRASGLFLAWGRQEPARSPPGSCPWHGARCCHCCSECLGPQPAPPPPPGSAALDSIPPRLASPASPIPPLARILPLPEEEDAEISPRSRRLPWPRGRRIWLIYSSLTDRGELGRADLSAPETKRRCQQPRRSRRIGGVVPFPCRAGPEQEAWTHAGGSGAGRGHGKRRALGSQPGKRRDRIPPSPSPPDKLFRVGTPTRRTLPRHTSTALLPADPGCFTRGKT